MAGFERSTVLSGGVGPGTGLGGDVRGVGICKLKCYICSVDREPQLGINRFKSSLLLGYGDLVTDFFSKSGSHIGFGMELN